MNFWFVHLRFHEIFFGFCKTFMKIYLFTNKHVYEVDFRKEFSFHRFVLFIKSYIIQFFVSTKVRGLTKRVNLKTTLFKRIQNGTDLVQNVRMKHDHTVILSDLTLKE